MPPDARLIVALLLLAAAVCSGQVLEANQERAQIAGGALRRAKHIP